VPEPSLPSEFGALVRPLVVSTCDFDGVVIGGLAPLKGPLPVGHEGVAEVVDVGEEVSRFKPGDRAIIPWKISCGKCGKCRAGLTAHCTSVPREAAYSWGPTARQWGGFLSDLVAVPWADHMLCPLPAGVDPIAASGVADNITDAWRAVEPPLRARPGGRVLIAGGGGPGSIGLLSAGLAAALGAGEIVYLDWDEGRRATAEREFGAQTIDTTQGLPDDDLGGDFDVLVDGSGNPEALRLLFDNSGGGAIVTCTAGAIYAFGDIPFPVFSMYRRSVSFHTGWVSTRPLMSKPLELIASGRFDPRTIETAVVGFDDAATALAQPFTKLVFVREGAAA
jgi:threonine dehydrogenase-like Zn-dependent dehydrogenase